MSRAVIRRAGRIGLALALAMSVSACSDDSTSPAAESKGHRHDTFNAAGILILDIPLMSDSVAGNQDFCDRNMGVSEGEQILIENSREAVVGYGILSAPVFRPRRGRCEMAWTASDVPSSRGIFGLRVAAYPPVYFKQADAEPGPLQTRLPAIPVP
jgi:hypothetical protein